MVASDSLAAESIQEGGSFAANADNRGPMSQPAGSMTANTTDASNATILDAAPDAEAREVSEEWNEQGMLNSSLGRKDVGAGPTYNTAANEGAGVVDQTNREQMYGTGNAAPAPGYAAYPASQMGSSENTFMPKGKDLTEGGFDADAPNASGTTDIGGKNDPGRYGLQRIEQENTPYAGGAGPTEDNLTKDTKYDALSNETPS